jgi:hypothetical protein
VAIKRHSFDLTLEADGRQTEDEAVRSLRAFLKAAWRSWGLRCTSAERSKVIDGLYDSPSKESATQQNQDMF